MDDEAAFKARLGKVAGLLATLRAVDAEHAEKRAAILAEVDELIGGGAGIGAKLAELEAHFEGLWQGRYHGRYEWERRLTRPHLKRFLQSHGLDDIKDRMSLYLKDDSRFYVQCRHGFNIFVKNFNLFAPQNPAGGKADADVTETREYLERMRG